MRRSHAVPLSLALAALPALAQQSGGIAGRVTEPGGAPLAGVQVHITSPLLPTARTVVTEANGDYRFPYLPPGEYAVLFTLAGRTPEKRRVRVVLQQTFDLDLALRSGGPEATVEVAERATLADPASAELKSALTSEVLRGLPLGLEYRNLESLIPTVPYTQNQVRDPNGGGSGQDNVHLLDGVNVNLPMYGTVSTEPSTHDMDQVAVSLGGAAALDFNRSGGFTLNSISKSGTDAFTGEVAYQVQPGSLTAPYKNVSAVVFDDTQTYANGSVGGPLVKERLFFFFSYFRPTDRRENSSNFYGALPDYTSTRDEYFGKLTYAPAPDLLVHASYRNSARLYHHQGLGGPTYAPSTSDGGKVTLDLATVEASWTPTSSSALNLKFTDFANRNVDRPDLASTAAPALDGSVPLDVRDLAGQGEFNVPLPAAGSVAGAAAYNAAIAPYVAQYGYRVNGVPSGGGYVGGYPLVSNQNFYHREAQAAYDLALGTAVVHELHAGYQWYRDSEDLYRVSNGWGVITMPINVLTPNTRQAATFVAAVQQQGIGTPAVHSEFVSQNVEFNDRIRWRDFTFNLGGMVSEDQYYGAGLAPADTVSGYVPAPGNRYLEHETKFNQTFQPRLGAVWNYHGQDTVYVNYARFVPATSSLPRGSSWARNLTAAVNVYFDAAGNYLDRALNPTSTGKLWEKGITPRHTDEYLVGTLKDLGQGLSARVYARYRYSCNFWEDTRNDARVLLDPPQGVPRTLYIPDLTARLTQLGVPLDPRFPGNQAVIAQLDGAFTKYYQAALELEWRTSRTFLSASYAWSHYYGNFDQDATATSLANDSNIFVGSSNLADAAGQQLWDNKYGNLSGDRRHVVKVYGTCDLAWRAKVGLHAFYQSGEPWQYESYTPYLALITASGSTSRSDTDRYAEPAGCRRTDPHFQVDADYTQTLWEARSLSLSGMVTLFNVFNRQTGYDVQMSLHSPNPGQPQAFYAPRRAQLGLRLRF